MLWCAFQRHLALKIRRAALNSVLHQSTQGTQKSSQPEKYFLDTSLALAWYSAEFSSCEEKCNLSDCHRCIKT